METGLAGMGNGTVGQRKDQRGTSRLTVTLSILCALKARIICNGSGMRTGSMSRSKNGTGLRTIFLERVIAIGLRSAPTDRQRRPLAMELKAFDSKCATLTPA